MNIEIFVWYQKFNIHYIDSLCCSYYRLYFTNFTLMQLHYKLGLKYLQ